MHWIATFCIELQPAGWWDQEIFKPIFQADLAADFWCCGKLGLGKLGPGKSGPGILGPWCGKLGPGKFGPGKSSPGKLGPDRLCTPGQSGEFFEKNFNANFITVGCSIHTTEVTVHTAHSTLLCGVQVPMIGECMSVEFMWWYFTYSENNWGDGISVYWRCQSALWARGWEMFIFLNICTYILEYLDIFLSLYLPHQHFQGAQFAGVQFATPRFSVGPDLPQK